MASPYPPLLRFLLARPNQRRRLRIMNHEKIFRKLNALAILLVMHQKNIASLLRQVVLAALQRIMEGLSHLEEVIPSGDDIPVRIYLHFIQ